METNGKNMLRIILEESALEVQINDVNWGTINPLLLSENIVNSAAVSSSEMDAPRNQSF